jgi:hypothetical protein
MKITSDAGNFVELEPRFATGDADLALVVRVSRDGFVGESEASVSPKRSV